MRRSHLLDMTEAIERLEITGRVQGVFYRKWARDAARSLGLRGFVRNRSDGSVEAVVAGPQESIDAFAEACRKGPERAQVSSVRRSAAKASDVAGYDGVFVADDA